MQGIVLQDTYGTIITTPEQIAALKRCGSAQFGLEGGNWAIEVVFLPGSRIVADYGYGDDAFEAREADLRILSAGGDKGLKKFSGEVAELD